MKKKLSLLVALTMMLGSMAGLAEEAQQGPTEAELLAKPCEFSLIEANGEQPRLTYIEGVTPILEVDGYKFKDLNKNGELDPYEDWRLTPEERTEDLLSRMSDKNKAAQMAHMTLVTLKESWFSDLDIGFALSDAVSEGLVAEPVWTDPLSVIVPVRHPLLAHAEVPLDEALRFPLVLCHPDAGSGCHHQIQAVLQGASKPLKLVDQVTSLGVMLTLVGAGYGLGFAIASQVQTLNRPDITVRPLAGTPPMLSTYLLRRSAEPSEPMKRFLQRAREEFLPKGDEPAS